LARYSLDLKDLTGYPEEVLVAPPKSLISICFEMSGPHTRKTSVVSVVPEALESVSGFPGILAACMEWLHAPVGQKAVALGNPATLLDKSPLVLLEGLRTSGKLENHHGGMAPIGNMPGETNDGFQVSFFNAPSCPLD